MAIRFACACGHHLKARDEMAGRRTMCPACGAPVGIPALEPTHRGTETLPSDATRRTMTWREPVEAASHSDMPGTAEVPDADAGHWPQGDKEQPVGPADCWREAACKVRLVTVRERRLPRWRRPRAWDLETRWHQCLKYPWRQLPMLLALAAALAVATGVSLLLLPHVLQGNLVQNALSPLILVLCLWAAVPVVVVGHACLFLSRVVHHAALGQTKYLDWPERDPGPPLACLGRWCVCFLCGPALAAWASVYYWLHCGAMGPLDWVILTELLVPATGYWLVAVLVASQAQRMADVTPGRILTVIGRLGSHALAVAALGFAVLLTHLLFGLYAIEQLHRSWTWGTLLLGVCWFSALYGSTVVFRVLGLWYFRFARPVRVATPPVWAMPGMAFAPGHVSGPTE